MTPNRLYQTRQPIHLGPDHDDPRRGGPGEALGDIIRLRLGIGVSGQCEGDDLNARCALLEPPAVGGFEVAVGHEVDFRRAGQTRQDDGANI